MLRRLLFVYGAFLSVPSSLFCMEETSFLDGSLKPVAHVIERQLNRYLEFEESNPRLAELAFKGAMITAKGLVGAGVGVVGCGIPATAACGPACGATAAVACAGEGFIFGIDKGVADEVRGAVVSGLAGEQLDAVISKGIDKLAPGIMRLDHTLDAQEAKILASAVISLSLTASEFKTVGKGMVKSIKSGYPGGHSVLDTVAHGTKNGLHESSLEQMISAGHAGHATTISKHSAPSAVTHARKQAGQEISALFNQALQMGTAPDLEVSKQAAQLEKSPDRAAADSALQALQKKAADDAFKYKLTHDTIADTVEGFSALLSIAGDHKEARQLAVMGNAGLKLMDGCHMLATGAPLLGGFSGAAMLLSPLDPFTKIAGAVALLVSLGQDDDNGLAEALNAMYQALSSQIQTLHEHMMVRFDHLDEKVDRNHLESVLRFIKMSQQLRDFSASTAYSLASIEGNLQKLHVIDSKLDALLVRPFVLACSAVERHPSRHDSLATMKRLEVEDHYKVLESALLGVDPKFDHLNGHVCSDFRPSVFNRMVTPSESETLRERQEALLGYLAKYKTTVLQQPLPAGVKAENLPHVGAFALGLEKYLALRDGASHVSYDGQGKALTEIAGVGEHAVGFIQSIQHDKPLFEKLFANYQASYQKVQALYPQAFEKRSQELLDAVHANAVQVNQQELALMPGFVSTSEGFYTEHFSNYINPTLQTKHLSHQPELSAAANWVAQSRSRFKVPLLASQRDLLNLDNTILDAIVRSGPGTRSDCQLPLNVRAKASIIERNIPMEAVIAERLKLGGIDLVYTWDGACGYLLDVFFKKNDNVSLHICRASLSGSCTDPYADKCFLRNQCQRICSTLNFHGLAIERFDLGVEVPSKRQRMKSVWANAQLASWTTYPEAKAALSALVGSRLVELRKEALRNFQPGTALYANYEQALDELDASYNALQAFGTVAGLGKPTMDDLAKLAHKRSILDYQTRYCAQETSEAATPFLKNADGVVAQLQASTVAQCAQPARENSFSTPLSIMLARLKGFAVRYPEIVQRRQAEQARKARMLAAAAAAVASQPTAREAELTQQVVDLKQQMGQMMIMMQRMQQLLEQKQGQ
jgi:hypothetical protein